MSRVVRRIALIVIVVLLAAGAWVAWRAWQVRADLVEAADSATRLRAAVTEGDQPEAEEQLARLQEHAGAAAARTDGPTWSMAAHLPFVGDDLEAVAVVSATLADLSEEGLTPLVDSAARLEAGSFTPRAGRLPVEDIESLQAPVARASRAFTDADAALAGVDTDGLLGTVAGELARFSDQVADGSETLAAADRAVRVLPGMLGADGDRRYLLVFQNNAEVRASGGMPGAMSVIEARGGWIEMTQGVYPGDFPVLDEPVLPLSAEELAVFGDQVGTFMQDANFTPDFPRTAELMAAHWDRTYDVPLDGVLSVDPVALSYLLAVTGPVTVDGVTLTADNAVEELLNNTYLRLPEPEDQDEFFRDVADAVFAAFTEGSGAPVDLVRALARGVDERRLLVRSFDRREQEVLAGSPVAGELPTRDDERPQVGVYLNDATGSKMSYYLDYDVEVAPVSCTGGVQELEATMTVGSHPPPEAADLPASITGGGRYGVAAGDQMIVADLFGPVSGEMARVRVNGRSAHARPVEYAARPVASLALYLEPGGPWRSPGPCGRGSGRPGTSTCR